MLTNPVRGFAERAVARAWPGRHARGSSASTSSSPIRQSAPSASATLAESREETPVQSFVTSEVISAFHLQQVHLPNGLERTTKGVVTGGKVAIVASAFALISLVGFDSWRRSPEANQGAAEQTPLLVATVPAGDVALAGESASQGSATSASVFEAPHAAPASDSTTTVPVGPTPRARAEERGQDGRAPASSAVTGLVTAGSAGPRPTERAKPTPSAVGFAPSEGPEAPASATPPATPVLGAYTTNVASTSEVNPLAARPEAVVSSQPALPRVPRVRPER